MKLLFMWPNSCTSMTGGYGQKTHVYVQIQITVNEPPPIFLLQLYTFEGCDPECLKCTPEMANTDLRRSFYWENFLELQKIESYWRCYHHMTDFNLPFWILLMNLKINSFIGIFSSELHARAACSENSSSFLRLWKVSSDMNCTVIPFYSPLHIKKKFLVFVCNTLLECWLEC